MVYLKEDGSLDIERINNLPIEEYMEVIGNLTKEQYQYYLSKSPINEGNEHTKAVVVDYTLEEELERGSGVDIEEYLNNWKKELEKR